MMREADYGRIVNIASIAGKEGNPKLGPYSASKAGVIGMTKSLAKEVAETGIRVHSIAPAVIQTPMLEQVRPPPRRHARPRPRWRRQGRGSIKPMARATGCRR